MGFGDSIENLISALIDFANTDAFEIVRSHLRCVYQLGAPVQKTVRESLGHERVAILFRDIDGDLFKIVDRAITDLKIERQRLNSNGGFAPELALR
jgi:hypothetical protein